jgi:hypothetical protein
VAAVAKAVAVAVAVAVVVKIFLSADYAHGKSVVCNLRSPGPR